MVVSSVPACGGDDDDPRASAGDLDSVTDALAALPDDGEESTTILWGDIARAVEIAGLDRPTDPADGEAVRAYMTALTGVQADATGPGNPTVAVLPPSIAPVGLSGDLTEFVDDVGWSVLQVDRYVESSVANAPVTVLEGSFDEASLTDALGEAQDGTRVAGSGEPGSVDPRDTSPARPRGESLWLSGGDPYLTIGPNPDAVEATTTGLGHSGDGDMVEDPALAGLARALDEQSAYAANLNRPGPTGVGALGHVPDDPNERETFCKQLLPHPTTAAATAAAQDDGPVILIALAHTSPDAADANAAALETMITTGTSALRQRPWSELVELDSIDTTSNGLVTLARLRPIDPTDTFMWFDLTNLRDTLVTSC